ncbi:DUF6220 domain-containing protein [Caldalkalibacillus salinus]|uniref:DUF6220 domain-containing protein n=1 Tax=Caldalkalibacillus salinus TaxID=2803787 RepID=UPI0019225B92|nr:DUF6220 domain-containing protein [Caldalkalibacillus salinus]
MKPTRSSHLDASISRLEIVRVAYLALAWIFMSCLLVQMFLAGLALFTPTMDWSMHRTFVEFFAPIPLVMFLLALPLRRQRWLSLSLFILVALQFMTIHLAIPIIAALHPVIALLLFWGALVTVKRHPSGEGRTA